ncbi:MAG: adenylate/guanylate cyclase domain-containing protein, partial [Chloroflexi bacterium]|nr:adenylate/guanylate cyclase domain-containing protein [Chloroflexota bacterium]
FSEDQLGQYEIMLPRRHRSSHLVLMDRSMDGLVAAIAQAVEMIEPLCSYLPRHVLDLVVENVARRGIPADFADPTVLFVNLIGLSESAHPELSPEENEAIATLYCHAFALINAAVESRGGMLKKVTYHLSSSDTMILFGVPVAHANNAYRAAKAALAIREIIQELPLLNIGGQQIKVACKIGMAQGAVFAAELGSPRGRREFNVLGDCVNVAARLMGAADPGSIMITDRLYDQLSSQFLCEELIPLWLKGKAERVPVCLLHHTLEG